MDLQEELGAGGIVNGIDALAEAQPEAEVQAAESAAAFRGKQLQRLGLVFKFWRRKLHWQPATGSG